LKFKKNFKNKYKLENIIAIKKKLMDFIPKAKISQIILCIVAAIHKKPPLYV